MRDIVMFGLAPSMIKRPGIGAVVFIWISLMNLHWLPDGAGLAACCGTDHARS